MRIDIDSADCTVFNKITDLYDKSNIDELINKQAILEYIDTSEEEGAMIANRQEDFNNESYTHMEIHPSILLGVMGNQIIFPENNPLPRDLFSWVKVNKLFLFIIPIMINVLIKWELYYIMTLPLVK